MSALKIRIAANFTVDPIEEPLGFWMRTLGIDCEIAIAPYNQVFQQLLEGGMLRNNRGGVNLIGLDLNSWLGDGPPQAPAEKLHSTIDDLASVLKAAGAIGAGGAILVFPFASHGDRALSLHAAKRRLLEQYANLVGWHVIDLEASAARYAVQSIWDPFTDRLGHIPFTEEMYTVAATMAARWIRTSRTKPRKVIALDCDQTLWQGIFGEGSMCVTQPYRQLQEFMLRQRDQGMLLTLVSKNNEEDVLGALESEACVLRAEHCAAWQINWQPKSENLKQLSDDLGLALNSFIFIDDNPIECLEVRNRCPEVAAVQLPSEPEAIPAFLDHMWIFDRMAATDEDRNRSAMYAAERQRNELSKKALTPEEFLASLQIEIDFARCVQSDLARVAQLTQRTTQFNTTGIQQTEQSLTSLLSDGTHECWTVRVKDVFGDYGLVGVALFETQQKVLRMDVFLMSCRVLGRRVENSILERVKELAIERGADKVLIPVIPTARNRPLREFLAQLCGVSAETRQPFECVLDAKENASEWRSTEAQPPEQPEQPPLSKPERSVAPPALIDEHSLFTQIANRFQTASSIVAAVRSSKVARPLSAGEVLLPRNSVEQSLANIWSDVLGVEPVGVGDDFFALGGQSLCATRVLTRIKGELGVELGLAAIYSNPTVEKLAAEISEKQSAASDQPSTSGARA